MGKLRKPAKIPRYDGIKEKYGGAIDIFLKEYGDGMNYANAQPFLAKEGIDVSKATYSARVLHFRRVGSSLKKKQDVLNTQIPIS